ncbi:MAG: hypothetical protein A2Y73_01310 [Chloroflexi bacterium RBG_13_56_8]|nr:MAG: hypothetical protein A2Y73_01310 [Chloroflexi bacterium RBG_13_56_8]
MTTKIVRPCPVKNPSVNREEIVFSHPSESEFARVLDFYGIEWRYEPTTFPLRWDVEGNLLEAFTPDFYLVQQDLYVELTTLLPRLMRDKRRKMRRLHKLYPQINAKLWDRNDFLHLLERCGIEERSQNLVGREAIKEEEEHV